MNSLSMLAVSWEPELRGYVVVIISAVVLIGGSYLVVGTNLGARLGFLVNYVGQFRLVICLKLTHFNVPSQDFTHLQVPGVFFVICDTFAGQKNHELFKMCTVFSIYQNYCML
jgi:hypothetical protein